MAGEFDALLNQVGQGSPSESTQAYDQLLNDVIGQQDFTSLLDEVGPGRRSGWQGLGSSFFEGLQRNLKQLSAVPSSLRAVYHDVAGDPIEGLLAAQQAQQIEDEAPKAQWSLKDVRSPDEFAHWFMERFGENALTLLTTAVGGGGGMLAGQLGARALGGSLATRAVAARLGGLAGAFGTTTATETAGTASELAQATGSTHPEWALPAGLAKGLLELWLPATVTHALTTPGKQLGSSIPRALLRTAGMEAGTETLQEAIDVAARMYNDPSYEFFNDGAWRLAEAGLAGGLIGGLVGGYPAIREARDERRGPDASGLAPGGRLEVPPEAPPGPAGAPSAPVSGEAMPAGMATQDEPLWAAVRVNGQVYTGVSHAAAKLAAARDLPDGNPVKNALTYGESAPAGVEDGLFVTRSGQVITREQAGGIDSGRLYDARERLGIRETAKEREGWKYEAKPAEMLRQQPEGFVEVYRGDTEGFDVPQVWKAAKVEPGLFFTDRLREADQYSQGRTGEYKTGSNIRRTVLDTRNLAQMQMPEQIEGLHYQNLVDKELARLRDAGYDGVIIDQHGRKQYIVWNQQAIMAPGKKPSENLVHLAGGKVQVAPRTPEGFAPSQPANENEVTAPPEAPAPEMAPRTPADTGQAGPVSVLRDAVEQGPAGNLDLKEVTQLSPQLDPADVRPLIRSTGLTEETTDFYMNWFEANTPRYAAQFPGEGFNNILMNDTDLELETVKRPQSAKPTTWLIDQNTLIPAMITAEVMDLPPSTSRRVWFIPGTSLTEQQEVLQRYDAFREKVEARRYEYLQNAYTSYDLVAAFNPEYSELIKAGLRVVPSLGASFYYGAAGLKGVRTEVARTSRSPQFATLLPDGTLATTFSSEKDVVLGGVPVSIDHNKVKPGELTAVPMRVQDNILPYYYENIPAEKQAEVHAEVAAVTPYFGWTALDVTKLKAVLKKYNTYIDPRKYKTNQIAMLVTDYNTKLTPGVNKTTVTSTENSPMFAAQLNAVAYYRSAKKQSMQISVAPEVRDLSHVKAVRSELRKLVPVFTKLLNKMGLENLPKIKFETSSVFKVAQYDMNTNTISFYFNPGGSDHFSSLSREGIRQEAFTTFAHELGHKLTMHYYALLPSPMQQQILYAYNKALLARRQLPGNVQYRLGPDAFTDQTVPYYSSFVEWLAEQFRRFSYSDQETRSELDMTYKQLSNHLEVFYRELETSVSQVAAKDFTQPDYFFSGWMQYLRNYGETKQRIKQISRQQTLYAIDTQIYENPQSTLVMDTVLKVLEAMKPMMPAGHPFHLAFSQQLDQNLDPNFDASTLARTVFGVRTKDGVDKALMELAIGSLHNADETQIGEVFAHELIHVYRYLGIISKEELNVLYTSAIRDGKIASPALKQALREQVKTQAARFGWDAMETEQQYQDALREEVVAYYVGEFAKTGIARPEAQPLLQRILNLLKEIARAMMGKGYATRDQILEAFFRGDMVNRANAIRKQQEQTTRFVVAMFEPLQANWQEEKDVDERYSVRISRTEPDDDTGHISAIYQYIDKVTSDIVGQQELTIIPNRGFNVEMHFSKTPGQAFKWLQFVQKDLGMQLLGPRHFTISGFKAAARMFPAIKKYYVFSRLDGDPTYYSPKFIKQMRDKLQLRVAAMERLQQQGSAMAPTAVDLRYAQAQLRLANILYSRIPKDIWGENKHLLDQLFMLPRNWHRDEVQGTLIRDGVAADEAQLDKVAVGTPSPDRLKDSVEKITDDARQESQFSAAQQLGVSFDSVAPQQPMAMQIRRLIAWADKSGKRVDPRHIHNLKRVSPDVLISQEADRIGWFSTMYWGLRQLIWRNEHLTHLQVYGQRVEQYAAAISQWHQQADELARVWEQRLRTRTQRTQFNELMYWLAEMEYLTPAERAADIVRHPSRRELETEVARRGLNIDAVIGQPNGLLWMLYQPPWLTTIPQPAIFARFLNEVERVSIQNIQTSISDPVLQAQAIAKVQAELNELRQKPYYPTTRFGQHTITVRDADPANNNQVLYFRAFDSHIARDNALPDVRRLYPIDHLHVGRMPEEYLEFLGLPGPLIRNIRENMPNLDATQVAWLEELERQNLPDKAFRSRWTKPTGTPGYDLDAFRSFAHYFMHGSRYLARMEFRNPMLREIRAVEASQLGLPNHTKRRRITDYMKKHYNYLMEGGRDWAKFKASIAALQLGFSPAAAFFNLTQTPMVSWPWLGGIFKSSRFQLTKSIKAVRGLRHGSVTSGVGNYQRAREEMIRQGRIDIGQAAELGAYAEGMNLNGFFAGNTKQKMFRNWVWYSMWMFQKAEQANREILMHATWELGLKNFDTTPRIKEIENNYQVEILELQTRTGMTYRECVVFVLAKEGLDQTQGLYAPYARPGFMRKPAAGTFLIFYQFTQMMSYAFFYNPGAVRMWLLMAFMYGMTGLPGMEDWLEIIRAVSVAVLGKDFNIQLEARRLIRQITRGTIFDEVGPDLFLHGISRYAFGLGLLPDGYGIGRFDASANGSMGKMIPAAYELAHGIATAAPFDRVVADVSQRAAGAGIGWAFNLVQFSMQSPGTVDGHRWEQALPRSIRAMAAGLRYLPPELNPGQVQTYAGLSPSVGALTTASGAKIVNFNAADPDHLAEIVGQMLGFRPTRVSEAQEARREITEMIQIFRARRTALMVQFSSAMLGGDTAVQDRVMQAIQKYNDEVAAGGFPTMGITNDQLRQSQKSRARSRLLQEDFIPDQRMFRAPAEKMLDLFPGVKAQRVR